MKKKTRKISGLRIACICIGLLVCAGAIISFGYGHYERGKATQHLAELNQQYGPEKAVDRSENNRMKLEVNVQAALYSNPVDFSALRKKNNDIKAWIAQDQVGVDYPVVQTDNNEYYLNHSFDSAESDYGTIMINSDNHSPFKEDQNTIIFGHNMKDGKMFGSLRLLENEKEKQNITVYLPSEILYYHIFCVAVVPPDAPVYRIAFSGQEMKECMEYLKDVAIWWENPTTLPDKSHLLTLSTCAGEKRLIVWAYNNRTVRQTIPN